MCLDLQPLRNCSCTEALSGLGTDLEKFEEDAAEKVGEVWEKVALLVQKVHKVMSHVIWPNPSKSLIPGKDEDVIYRAE